MKNRTVNYIHNIVYDGIELVTRGVYVIDDTDKTGFWYRGCDVDFNYIALTSDENCVNIEPIMDEAIIEEIKKLCIDLTLKYER